MTNSINNTVQTDSEGRVDLGAFAKEGERFYITVDQKNRIILEPLKNIPENEKWIYENPEIYEGIQRGMEQSQKGKTKSLGSFSQYMDEE